MNHRAIPTAAGDRLVPLIPASVPLSRQIEIAARTLSAMLVCGELAAADPETRSDIDEIGMFLLGAADMVGEMESPPEPPRGVPGVFHRIARVFDRIARFFHRAAQRRDDRARAAALRADLKKAGMEWMLPLDGGMP